MNDQLAREGTDCYEDQFGNRKPYNSGAYYDDQETFDAEEEGVKGKGKGKKKNKQKQWKND
eukprot:1829450-Alexandrium_andersonii.AAC.1